MPSTFEETRQALLAADPDSESFWSAVRWMHAYGGLRAFAFARDLYEADAVGETMKATALAVLSQLGGPERPFRAETHGIVRSALRDPSATVREAAVYAAAHLAYEDTADDVAGLSEDASRAVRLAVAFAAARLPAGGNCEVLMSLACDSEPTVREWSAFQLAELDPEAIRAARFVLVKLLSDGTIDVAAEAARALSRISDPEGLRWLRSTLESGIEGVTLLEAAENYASPSLVPVLQELQSSGTPNLAAVNDALYACTAASQRS
ncbi:MAG: HEAT repeat domain-containing protein [Sandaracinaceae bacterium]|nr:HEAT repeat domain-containing protein [Sandaracinaceae bacterium]